MARLLCVFLFGVLGSVSSEYAGTACSSGSFCEGQDDELGMLQLRGQRAAPRGYPLGFELYVIEMSRVFAKVFRLTIRTQVLGTSFNLMLDTGSPFLALCNGTTSLDGAAIPSTKPMPAGAHSGTYNAALYGNGHGFTSAVYNGGFAIGNLSSKPGEDSQYEVMLSKRGERDNACGIPLADMGASRMEGFFGFSGPDARGYTYRCSTPYADLKPGGPKWPVCRPEDRVVPKAWTGPFTALEGSKHFGISVFGSSGALFVGSEANALLETTYADSKPVYAAMLWQNKMYSYSLKTYSAKVAGVMLAGSERHCREEVCTGIVDTGAPTMSMPAETLRALEAHFATSEEPATFEIGIAGKSEGSHSTLSFQISPYLWKYGGLMFSESEAFTIGLAAWLWYEHVHFDVEGEAFSFIPRSDMAVVNEALQAWSRPLAELTARATAGPGVRQGV